MNPNGGNADDSSASPSRPQQQQQGGEDSSGKRRKVSSDDMMNSSTRSIVHAASAPAAPVFASAGSSMSIGGVDQSSNTNNSNNNYGDDLMQQQPADDHQGFQSISDLYDLKEELGKGAFSVVYRAIQRSTGENVAIKLIGLGNFTGTERARQERILDNEIKIMRKISRDCTNVENLIVIKDVVREENRLAIVMEVLQGKELFDRIVSRQRYTEADAAQLMNTIMRAVQTLHSAGIIHRDLKPENLVFTTDAEDASVKITDFGLAMVTDWPDVHNTVVGTPNYVAPEVVSIQPRGPFYGPECDVWSMGVILYTMLVGYPPFYHNQVAKLFKQIRAGDYEFHHDQWKDISDDAVDLVRKMLVVDPKKRFTCEQVLNHRWLQNAPNSVLPATQKEMRKLNAKRRFKAAAMAVVWGAQLGLRRKLLDLVDSSKAKIFDLDELQRIRSSFQLHAHNNRMNKAAFSSTLEKLGFTDVPIDRMFALFDRNGDNSIDYKEFLGSLSTLRESGEDALKMCFSIYDENNSGYIDRDQVAKVLSSMIRVSPTEMSEKLEGIFRRIDTNHDGKITYDEFKKGIFSEPVLVEAFFKPMESIGSLPIENFAQSNLDRGIIDAAYLEA